MVTKRKPFQGVLNIIRFNWHFYVGILVLIIGLVVIINFSKKPLQNILSILLYLTIILPIISLVISYFVYDLSSLYQLNWLDKIKNERTSKLLNIHAGFDEISEVLKQKFSDIDVTTCDFYNPQLHTEISIKRARKFYPPSKESISVDTNKLPFAEDSFKYVIVFLAAHEIRNNKERIQFFKEIHRVTNNNAIIYVTEHLRDVNNFIAYTLGAFHFYSYKNWVNTFKNSNFTIIDEIKNTPFIRTFKLQKNGNSS